MKIFWKLIHTQHDSSPSINVLWSKTCMSVKNIKIILGRFNFKPFIIHNNASFSEKVHPLSIHINTHQQICLDARAWSVHISLLIQIRWFFTGEILWIEYLWIIVVFLSAVWTLILKTPIHMSDEETNSSTSWMARGLVNFQQILFFWWTIPLNNFSRHSYMQSINQQIILNEVINTCIIPLPLQCHTWQRS